MPLIPGQGGPPPTISLPPQGGDMPFSGDPAGGPLGPDATAGPAADAGQGQPGPDSPKVVSLVQSAITALDQAKKLEQDPGDQALIAKLVAECHKFIGDQQGLVDKATGAGPGAKLVRKTAPAGAGGY